MLNKLLYHSENIIGDPWWPYHSIYIRGIRLTRVEERWPNSSLNERVWTADGLANAYILLDGMPIKTKKQLIFHVSVNGCPLTVNPFFWAQICLGMTYRCPSSLPSWAHTVHFSSITSHASLPSVWGDDYWSRTGQTRGSENQIVLIIVTQLK